MVLSNTLSLLSDVFPEISGLLTSGGKSLGQADGIPLYFCFLLTRLFKNNTII